jgi:hypothetical protein
MPELGIDDVRDVHLERCDRRANVDATITADDNARRLIRAQQTIGRGTLS